MGAVAGYKVGSGAAEGLIATAEGREEEGLKKLGQTATEGAMDVVSLSESAAAKKAKADEQARDTSSGGS
jgi:hypothetical protein